MVKYCIAYGCGRNNKANDNLSFYSFPKEKHRYTQWLKLLGREDLMSSKWSRERKVCSLHFAPSDIKNKNRHLDQEAVPTRFLPGHWDEAENSDAHPGVVCNSCEKPMSGFRYKCVTCDDYDLCKTCEGIGTHPQHFMLRIPKHMMFKQLDNLIKKWRKLFNAEHVMTEFLETSVSTGLTDDSSDDDQPITKYARNYDSGVDLSEDVKETIRKEINRVTNLKLDKPKKVQIQKKNEKKRQTIESERDRSILSSKRLKVEEEDRNSLLAPEVVFADVNNGVVVEIKPDKVDLSNLISAISSEPNLGPSSVTPAVPLPSTSAAPSVIPNPATFAEVPTSSSQHQQPVMHVKLSDDLTELMIEVTSNNQRTVYKYPETGNPSIN